jgi:hypothetical protein
MRLPYEISHYFAVVRFSFDISCLLAVVGCPYEICYILLRFHAFWPLCV